MTTKKTECGICGRERCTCYIDLAVWDRITKVILAQAQIEVLRELSKGARR